MEESLEVSSWTLPSSLMSSGTLIDINTNGHCFLCLKGEESTDILSSSCSSVVSGNPKGIGSFKHLLCYLTGLSYHQSESSEEDNGGDGADPKDILKVIGGDNGDRLPPLCGPCYDNLFEINKLHNNLLEIQREIQKKTEIVRETVLKTTVTVTVAKEGGGAFQQNGRDRFMDSLANSELPLDQISYVSSLIIKIHEYIISQGSNPVRFPIHAINEGPAPENSTAITVAPPPTTTASVTGGATAGVNVCGVPVDPTANYVMITTNVTDPETGAVTVQPVLLNITQLQAQVQAPLISQQSQPPPPRPASSSPVPASNNNHLLDIPLTVPLTNPLPLPIPSPSKKRKRISPSHTNKTEAHFDALVDPSTAHSIYESELRLQLCDVCNERIPRGPHGSSHLACHVGGEYVSYCPDCQYGFISPYRLLDFHKGRHLPCKPDPVPLFQCDLCPFQAEWMFNLRRHLQEHEKDPLLPPTYNCPLCPLKYKSKKMVQLHLGDKHVFLSKLSGRQTCDICKSYFRFEEIESHLVTHGVTSPLRCKMCLSMFTNLDAMIKHQGYAKQKGLHEKVCHICQNLTKFMTLTALRTHYFEAHSLGSKHVCDICNDEFLTKDRWIQHQERFHASSSTYKPSTSSSSSNKPRPPKKKRSDKYLACPDCGDLRAPRYQLLKHRIEKHNHPPLTCPAPYCDATFTSEKDRKLHFANDHQGFTILPPKISRLKCDECDLEFPDRSGLNLHKKKHSNERPYHCDLCDAKYKSRSGLNVHMVNTHLKIEKERRFICGVCQKGFYTDQMLNNHKLIHTGERPYACQHCGQTFRQEVALRTHERGHIQLGDKFKPKGEMERKK